MKRLIEAIRLVVSKAPVNQNSIENLREFLADAVPRLQSSGLCDCVTKPGRYLCYRDEDYGFVVMLMAWGPGDATPIHDHGTWGVEAVLKNELMVTSYDDSETAPQPIGGAIYRPGDVMYNLPPARDVHKVEHHRGGLALSLHIYGKDMNSNRVFVQGQGFKPSRLETCPLEEVPGLTSYSSESHRNAETPSR